MDIHDWFLTLPEGEQKVLREDRWMLAARAWEAALTFGKEPVAEAPCSAGLVDIIGNLMEENAELKRILFMYSTAFIHYYEDNNGVCKLCTLKEDEVLHEKVN